VLHIYQIASQRDDIGINLDGINWSKLLKTSKEKMTIPNSNDQNRKFSENISEVNIEMGQRKSRVTTYQNIVKYDSKTPAGHSCL
jgi:hypothetical protein